MALPEATPTAMAPPFRRLSDRRGLREISAAPSVAQLAHFVRRKEMMGVLWEFLWETAPKEGDVLWGSR